MKIPLPKHLIRLSKEVEEPKILFIRHSDRFSIPAGDSGVCTPLNEHGIHRAHSFGEQIANEYVWAWSSPIQRCMHTAELMGLQASPSNLLGAPGPFVIDSQRGGEVFSAHETKEVIRAQNKGETWGCMRSLHDGVQLLVNAFVSQLQYGSGIAVSHDAIVIPLISYITKVSFDERWLDPLDGVLLVSDAMYWEGKRYSLAGLFS